jgi:hypothetical protein
MPSTSTASPSPAAYPPSCGWPPQPATHCPRAWPAGYRGVLVVAVSVPAQHRIAHLAALTGAAHAVGLRHAHHLALVDPARYHAATVDIDGAGTHRPSGHTHGDAATGPHGLTPHTDLLIFTREDDQHD